MDLLLYPRPIAIVSIILLATTFSMNYIIKDPTNKLGLVTVNTFIADTQIWNLLTSQFYEKSLYKLIFDIIGITIISKSIKIKGGNQTFGLYFLICTLVCSMLTSAYCFIRYFSTGVMDMLTSPIFGFSGVFMIILTYARQQLQNEPIYSVIPNITYNNLPVLVIVSQLFLWLVGLKILAVDIPFSIIAMLFSWSYLRFFYKFEENNSDSGYLLGDRSDEFAFVEMFPEALHPIMAPMCTAFYNIFAMVGMFPELGIQAEKSKINHHLRYNDLQSGSPDSPKNLQPKSNAELIQERRRAKAIKVRVVVFMSYVLICVCLCIGHMLSSL